MLIVAMVVAAAVIPPAELSASVYKARRERVMNELGGCAAVLAAQGKPQGAVEEFHQDGDFFWLTGLNESDAWLELSPKAKNVKVRLWLRSRDPEAERWTG